MIGNSVHLGQVILHIPLIQNQVLPEGIVVIHYESESPHEEEESCNSIPELTLIYFIISVFISFECLTPYLAPKSYSSVYPSYSTCFSLSYLNYSSSPGKSLGAAGIGGWVLGLRASWLKSLRVLNVLNITIYYRQAPILNYSLLLLIIIY